MSTMRTEILSEESYCAVQEEFISRKIIEHANNHGQEPPGRMQAIRTAVVFDYNLGPVSSVRITSIVDPSSPIIISEDSGIRLLPRHPHAGSQWKNPHTHGRIKTQMRHDAARYNRKLDKLTAKKWRKQGR